VVHKTAWGAKHIMHNVVSNDKLGAVRPKRGGGMMGTAIFRPSTILTRGKWEKEIRQGGGMNLTISYERRLPTSGRAEWRAKEAALDTQRQAQSGVYG
jgi:hypothetical protein